MKNKIIEALKNEINWCEQNMDAMRKEHNRGFVEGLQQAVFLAEKMPEDE